MNADPPRNECGAVEDVLHPAYWLVTGLEWPGGSDTAEAAHAIAPGLIPHQDLSHDAFQILGCADLYARKHATRVIFFSDLTRMFAAACTSWAKLGVDWQNALRELQNGPFPALFVTITERVHLLICDPATQPRTAGPDGDVDERELVRQAITSKLAADWPPYAESLISVGRVRLAG